MNYSMRGITQVTDFLRELPRGVKISAMRAAAKYLIGDSQHGLKHNPARVQHDESNPYQWQSDAQRRWWFATHDGPYQRTGDLAAGWKFTESDSNWTSVKLENRVPYGEFVQGANIQRGHIADGWRKIENVIATNINGAIAAANTAVRQWVREHDR